MRVTTGSAKGRRLQAGRGAAFRPTADKVKGALFNILIHRVSFDSARVLDLFAGSGALGIEALSRGAAHVTFVEQAAATVRLLRENLRRCGFEPAARILQLPVQRALRRLAAAHERFDGILLDPPYAQGLIDATLASVAADSVLVPGGWVMVEHHVDEPPAKQYGRLRLTQLRRYGKTGLALFVAEEMTAPSAKEERPVRRAVYAGSFDPITNGHLDVVRRASEIFDEVIVAVAAGSSDPQKDRALFTAEERVDMIRAALAESSGQVRVDSFTGLLVDYCERVDARVNIRGLRAVSDFEYEFQMAMMNRHLKPRIETFFMAAGETHFYTASRLVKEVAKLGGDVRGLVPEVVHQRLMHKLKTRR